MLTYSKPSRVIVVILLFLAMAELPYGYYTFLRWVVFLVAVYHVFVKEARPQSPVIFFGMIAMGILFNPIAPVYFDKGSWIIIDFFCAIFLIASLLMDAQTKSN